MKKEPLFLLKQRKTATKWKNKLFRFFSNTLLLLVCLNLLLDKFTEPETFFKFITISHLSHRKHAIFHPCSRQIVIHTKIVCVLIYDKENNVSMHADGGRRLI